MCVGWGGEETMDTSVCDLTGPGEAGRGWGGGGLTNYKDTMKASMLNVHSLTINEFNSCRTRVSLFLSSVCSMRVFHQRCHLEKHKGGSGMLLNSWDQ